MLKKIIKRTLIILLILIVVGAIGSYIFVKQKMKAVPSELVLPKEDFTVNFVWDTATINNKLNDKAAMLIPVKLNGCPNTFYMQFDIGTFVTHFYKPELESINKKFKNIPFIINEEKDTILSDYSFNIGETKINTQKIELSSFGESIDWKKSNQKIVIGSIGPDYINGKTVCIDYPNQKITLYKKLPDTISKNITFFDFEWNENRAYLPIKMKGEKMKLFFDTGTSTNEFLTNKTIANQIATNNSKVEDYQVGSWGNQLDCHDIKINEIIEIANIKVPIERVSYIDAMKLKMALFVFGVDGFTGNKLFLNKKLYLDTENQKFGLSN